MAAYLDIAAFKDLTTMPSVHVDDLDTDWLNATLENRSRWIDGRLAKRYDVPFASPYPETVKGWLAAIVTLQAYLRRGVDPNDMQFLEIKTQAEAASSEVLEAANSNEGWFDLPATSSSSASAITRGAPLGYSEQSPYVSTDRQRKTGVAEDADRTGTGDT